MEEDCPPKKAPKWIEMPWDEGHAKASERFGKVQKERLRAEKLSKLDGWGLA